MSERLKSRKKTRFLYEGGVQIGEEEEVWEPTIQEPAPEFVGISETQSLPHGQKPLEGVIGQFIRFMRKHVFGCYVKSWVVKLS